MLVMLTNVFKCEVLKLYTPSMLTALCVQQSLVTSFRKKHKSGIQYPLSALNMKVK